MFMARYVIFIIDLHGIDMSFLYITYKDRSDMSYAHMGRLRMLFIGYVRCVQFTWIDVGWFVSDISYIEVIS